MTRTTGSVPEGRMSRRTSTCSTSNRATSSSKIWPHGHVVVGSRGDVDERLGNALPRRVGLRASGPRRTTRSHSSKSGQHARRRSAPGRGRSGGPTARRRRARSGPQAQSARCGRPRRSRRSSTPWSGSARCRPRLLIDVTTSPPPNCVARREVEREQGHQVVAVAHRPRRVHRDQAIGVAVKGEAEVGAQLEHVRDQVFGVGRAAALVDVAAVGLCRAASSVARRWRAKSS